ncbi:MAG: cytochrome c biogenesis protein ResB [Bdellovibrionales bacterium]|nr:cytochrome c biogenesis protein ResB [Bdellovibrionales bacterium]
MAFWAWIDRTWVRLASVKLTLVVFLALLLLSIPGTVILQYNISNVDPGIQYNYGFWKFGQLFQLFTSYHSFWYVGLIALLAINLIACSEQRWPQMWKLATLKPVPLSREAMERQPAKLRYAWRTQKGKDETLQLLLKDLKQAWARPVVLEDGLDHFQVFWQAGRWSRISNYVVHTSLLVIFGGAIYSSLYGFEGAANIPTGGAVDTFLIFKEGGAAGLDRAPGGLRNERMLGFRIQAEDFKVNFYEDYPGRPKEFISRVNILENGKVMKSGTLRVNEPMKYGAFTLYQASYGRLGDFALQLRVVDKKRPYDGQTFAKLHLGEPKELGKEFGGLTLVPVRALMNVQGLGPGVQFQEFRGNQPAGTPFWVLKNYPQFDFVKRQAPYGVVLDEVEELFFTGLQIASDPGAPVYWLGCAGMLLGTFYALFVTHRKYYLRFEKGELMFVGTIHRLPLGFEGFVAKLAERFKKLTGAIPAAGDSSV